MGGLWVDYNLMSTVPGLFVIGEANFSDHGANRLGASALMQGLADGYFVLPYTIGDYLARGGYEKVAADHAACRAAQNEARERLQKLLGAAGKRTADSFHRELGRIVWNHCGMSRNAAGLKEAIGKVAELREVFWRDVKVPGSGEDTNQALEVAARVADHFELGELMCRDALERDESCGAHFRVEHVTEDGEAKRDDEKFSHASVWEWTGEGREHRLHIESLEFENVKLAQRSYK
jgi:succinate dehydrogenase / fumarate reductase flavoprotein subunit